MRSPWIRVGPKFHSERPYKRQKEATKTLGRR